MSINKDFICEFCKNKYSNKSNLLMHQKTAKKCLIIRNNPIVNDFYKCEDCEYVSVRKSVFLVHQMSCKKTKKNSCETFEKIIIEKDLEINQLKMIIEKKELLLHEKNIQLERLDNEIKDYKIQLKDNFNVIASKPTIVNNTRINNLIVADFKESTIKDKVENKFTLEYLNDGLRGVAKFTKDHIVNSEDGKHKYLCCDPSRSIFKYKDENGVVQKDVRASKLKNAIKEPIIKKSKILFINENSILFDGIANGDNNENTELMNEQITILKDNFLKVKNIDDNQIDYAKEMVLIMNVDIK
jgi:hypothetical protein